VRFPIACVLLLGALLLGACGFHLRDEIRLPSGLERVALVVADEFSPLRRSLKAALERAGAQVLAAEAEGAGAVRVPVNAVTKDVLTVSGRARVQEYVVRHDVELEVVAADGRVLLARTPIMLEREFTFDETQGLGAAQEEELIRKELEREMAQQILRRIEALAEG
jgi:LPS-assembly lipoprotein